MNKYRQKKFYCIYCREMVCKRLRTRDHFVPRSKGGTLARNLVYCCGPCNQAKADKVFTSIAEVQEFIADRTANHINATTPAMNKKTK